MAGIGYAKVLMLTTVDHQVCIICYMEGKRAATSPSMRVSPLHNPLVPFTSPAWRARRAYMLATHLRDEHLGHPLVERVLGKGWK